MLPGKESTEGWKGGKQGTGFPPRGTVPVSLGKEFKEDTLMSEREEQRGQKYKIFSEEEKKRRQREFCKYVTLGRHPFGGLWSIQIMEYKLTQHATSEIVNNC